MSLSDYFLNHPEALEGQPKRAIADYVEQNGILVPRRFESFDEALKSGAPLIIRGEHQQDYNGASNIIPTFDLTFSWRAETVQGVTDYDKLKEKILADEERPLHWQYCKLMGLDKEKFKDEVSFSFWEKIHGINRAVIADSTVKGRYHIMSQRGEKPFIANYSVFENGNQVKSMASVLPEDLKDSLADLVELYEKIRNLGRFDENHCPIMEFQTDGNGDNYFLQYHRARDFKPTTFTLDREPEKDETEAWFVRGATLPEGSDYKVTLIYGGMVHRIDKDRYEVKLLEKEEGSFDLHYNRVFTELMTKKRKLQVITEGNFEHSVRKLIVEHFPRSKVFKPEISLVIDKSIFRDDNYKQKYQKARDTGEDQFMDLHVVSDGTRAYVKRA